MWCVLYTFLSSLTCENIFRILLLRETGAVAYRQQLQCADCLFCAVESVTYEKALLRNTCIHMWGFICAFRMLSAIYMYTQYCILCIVRRVYFHFNARLYFRLFPSLRLCVCSLACSLRLFACLLACTCECVYVLSLPFFFFSFLPSLSVCPRLFWYSLMCARLVFGEDLIFWGSFSLAHEFDIIVV